MGDYFILMAEGRENIRRKYAEAKETVMGVARAVESKGDAH